MNYLVVQNDQFKCLEEELTQPGRSWSRLWDLGLTEQPNRGADPQHCPA